MVQDMMVMASVWMGVARINIKEIDREITNKKQIVLNKSLIKLMGEFNRRDDKTHYNNVD